MASYTQDARNKLIITWVGLAWYIVMIVAGVLTNVPIMTGASVGMLLLIAICLVVQLVRRPSSRSSN